MKRSKIGNQRFSLFCAGISNYDETEFFFEQATGADSLVFYYYPGSYTGFCRTLMVFRDTSAWYHIVLALDTTQGTASDRCKIYVNGVQQSTTFTSNFGPSATPHINSTAAHSLGYSLTEGLPYDGYLADVHFIDGQALTPSSFTEVSATTGQLIPLAYSGSFGTNGFWLKFSDNSALTSGSNVGVGKDYSGNANYFDTSGLSVTAGAGNDSLVDTPTSISATDTGVGGEIRGNYATWNPLQSSAATLTNGNLDCTTASATGGQVRATIAVSSGKWYWEVTVNTSVTANNIGIIKTPEALAADRPGYFAGGYAYVGSSGNKENNASASAYGATYGSGDVIGVALDLTAGTLVFYKNGASQGTAFSSLTGEFIPCVGDGTGSNGLDMTTNFGQRAFAYQTPGTNRPAATFLALCDTNLGAPLVAKPNTLMDVALYTGNGSSQSITGLGFSPDLVWLKSRNATDWHLLTDTVRGTTVSLATNTTNADLNFGTQGVSAFNSDGFSVGNEAGFNRNGTTYVAWTWDAGTSTVSNTAGSITSQVRANPSAGFSVVTYSTGASSGNQTIGHGLNVTPSLIIHKVYSATSNWWVYHASTTNTVSKYIQLNSTNATADNVLSMWGAALPTSTVFGANVGQLLASNQSAVAYCFAPVVGYSSFGSYTGNGLADGPFVYTGFRPRWILIKVSAGDTGNWWMYDSARSSYNLADLGLYANSSIAEFTSNGLDMLSNGFKIRTANGNTNGSGYTFIYAAFAENPFQYARAR